MIRLKYIIYTIAFSLILFLIYSAWQEESREYQESLTASNAVHGLSTVIPGQNSTPGISSTQAAGGTGAPKNAADVPDVPRSVPSASSVSKHLALPVN